jgi:hypothetical protein
MVLPWGLGLPLIKITLRISFSWLVKVIQVFWHGCPEMGTDLFHPAQRQGAGGELACGMGYSRFVYDCAAAVTSSLDRNGLEWGNDRG